MGTKPSCEMRQLMVGATRREALDRRNRSRCATTLVGKSVGRIVGLFVPFRHPRLVRLLKTGWEPLSSQRRNR